jgi:membrane associated rhomboid family serine protease
MTLGFPPFTRAIKWLVISNAAIYLVMLILGGVAPAAARAIFGVGALTPLLVAHGWVWQVVSYSFLHVGLFHILFNMLTLWMFGSTLEMDFGFRQFLEFYFFCVVGAALVTIGIAYLGIVPPFTFLGITPFTATVGASGGIFGVMVAFAIFYGDQEFMMFPFPFMIRAKYLVAILIFIALAGAFQGFGVGRGESVAYFAHLGGALFGWFYVKFLPRRGLAYFFSERYYGTRNGYYRWKRRRAARKFEVYKRKVDGEVPNMKDLFDEYGNYRPPRGKGNGESKGRGGWVN